MRLGFGHRSAGKRATSRQYWRLASVVFGEAAVREALRAAGGRDTKACAVSERLTATRFHRLREIDGEREK